MKVAVIGPSEVCERIQQVVKKYFKGLNIVVYSISSLEEINEIIESVHLECEAILFSGIASYSYAMKMANITLPSIYIPYFTSSLIRSIMEIKENYKDFEAVSIDFMNDGEEIYDLFEELGLKNIKVLVKEYNVGLTEKDYIDFHENCQKKEKNTVAITGISSVYSRLENENYKVIRNFPVISTIRYSINKLISDVQMESLKKTKIAVQIIEVKCDSSQEQYENIKIGNYVEKLLIDYLKDIQGSIFNLGWNQYFIYTTSGLLSDSLNLSTLRKIMYELKIRKVKLYVGNGYGDTVYKSERNARRALEYSLKNDEGVVFEVNGEKIKGPLFSDEELEYEYIVNEEKFAKISEKLKVSFLYLKKIEAFSKKYNKEAFTSDELAKCLGVSIRSANRIMKKIIDGGYGEKELAEFSNYSGRPKSKIVLKW